MNQCGFAIIKEKNYNNIWVYTHQRISHSLVGQCKRIFTSRFAKIFCVLSLVLRSSKHELPFDLISYSPLSKIIQYLISTGVTGAVLYCLLRQSKHHLFGAPSTGQEMWLIVIVQGMSTPYQATYVNSRSPFLHHLAFPCLLQRVCARDSLSTRYTEGNPSSGNVEHVHRARYWQTRTRQPDSHPSPRLPHGFPCRGRQHQPGAAIAHLALSKRCVHRSYVYYLI